MPIVREEFGSPVVLYHARYHVKILNIEPLAADLIPPTLESIKTLKDAMAETENKEDVLFIARAHQIVAEKTVDNGIRELELMVFIRCNFSRKSPEYKSVFHKDVTSIKELKGREKECAVQVVLSGLQAKFPDMAEMHAGRLRQLSGKATAAETAVREAQVMYRLAFAAERSARQALVEKLRTNEGLLRARFPKERAYVRSFFKSITRKKKAEANKEERTATV